MKNIHILPTDKPSRLFLWMFEILRLLKNISVNPTGNVHIYITSDEEIKEGDWCYDDKYKQPFKYFGEGALLLITQKIILTTDQDLIKDGVQAIPDEFLEWFVKNSSCEKVEVTKEEIFGRSSPLDKLGFIVIKYNINMKNLRASQNMVDYFKKEQENILKDKIIIPKEEPKQCCDSGIVDDFCINTLKCKHAVGETKLETLEEASKAYACISFVHPLNKEGEQYTIPPGQVVPNGFTKHKKRTIKAFKAGAEWQQERSYSEEDMLEFGEWMKILPLTISGFVVKTKTKSIVVEKTKELLQIWVEQFKKK